jgi:hypothetical protein
MRNYFQHTVLIAAVLLFAASSPAADKKPKMKHFSGHGIEFDHDPRLKTKVERSDQVVTLNLTGYKGLVLTVQRAKLPLSGDDYAKAIVTGMHDGIEKGGGTSQPVIDTARITVGGQEHRGRSFKYSLLGTEFYYQAYGWDLSSGSEPKKLLAVTIQYEPKNEQALKPLVETVLESFKVTAE